MGGGLVGGGLVPIGQHDVELQHDGSLLMFNDGAPSFNQPTGASAGLSRPYAAVSDYTIDPASMTAVENWHYDHGQTYASDICSSVQQRPDGTLLIDYAATDNRSTMHVVGVDPNNENALSGDVCRQRIQQISFSYAPDALDMHHQRYIP